MAPLARRYALNEVSTCAVSLSQKAAQLIQRRGMRVCRKGTQNNQHRTQRIQHRHPTLTRRHQNVAIAVAHRRHIQRAPCLPAGAQLGYPIRRCRCTRSTHGDFSKRFRPPGRITDRLRLRRHRRSRQLRRPRHCLPQVRVTLRRTAGAARDFNTSTTLCTSASATKAPCTRVGKPVPGAR